MEGQKSRSRRRLNSEAYSILNDYFTNVSKWPDATAQEELAERVRRVPGCEFYTARQVYAYFANNRAKIRTLGKDAVLPTGDPAKRGRPRKATRTDLGPGPSEAISGPDSTIHKLDVLLDEEPDPSPQVAEIWAETMGNGVVSEHILTYAFLRRAIVNQEPWPESNEAQLRTPAQPGSPQVHPETPPPAQPLPQSAKSFTSHDVHARPPSPNGSPREGPEKHPGPFSIVPPSPPSTNNGQAVGDGAAPPESQPSLDPSTSGAQNAAGALPSSPANRTIGPDGLVERVRAALLGSDTPGPRECPKTFVDFARWLKAHNEDRGAALPAVRAKALGRT